MSNIPESYIRAVIGILIGFSVAGLIAWGVVSSQGLLKTAGRDGINGNNEIMDSFYEKYNGETYTGAQVIELIEKSKLDNKYIAVHQDNKVYYYICEYKGTASSPDVVQKIATKFEVQLADARSHVGNSLMYRATVKYAETYSGILGIDFERLSKESDEVARDPIIDTVGKGNPPDYSSMTDGTDGKKSTEEEKKKTGEDEADNEENKVAHKHTDGKGNQYSLSVEYVDAENFGGCFTVPVYHKHTDECLVYHRHRYTNTSGEVVGDDENETDLPPVLYLEDRVSELNSKLRSIGSETADTTNGYIVDDFNPDGKDNCYTAPVYYEHEHSDACGYGSVTTHVHVTATGKEITEKDYPNTYDARYLSELQKDNPKLDIELEGGGGCYVVPVYHKHTKDCYAAITHVHSGNPNTYGGCYTEAVAHVHTSVTDKTEDTINEDITYIGDARFNYKMTAESSVLLPSDKNTVTGNELSYTVKNKISYIYFDNAYDTLVRYFKDYEENGDTKVYLMQKPKKEEEKEVEASINFDDYRLKSGTAVVSGDKVISITQDSGLGFTVKYSRNNTEKTAEYYGVFPGSYKGNPSYDGVSVHAGSLSFIVENPISYETVKLNGSNLTINIQPYGTTIRENGEEKFVREIENPRNVIRKVGDENTCYKAEYYYPTYKWVGTKTLLSEVADQVFEYNQKDNVSTYTYTVPEDGMYTFYAYGSVSGEVKDGSQTKTFGGKVKAYPDQYNLKKGTVLSIKLGRPDNYTRSLNDYIDDHSTQQTIIYGVDVSGKEFVVTGEGGTPTDNGTNYGYGYVLIHKTMSANKTEEINEELVYQWNGQKTPKILDKIKYDGDKYEPETVNGVFVKAEGGYQFVAADQGNEVIKSAWIFTDKDILDNTVDNDWRWYHANDSGNIDLNTVVSCSPSSASEKVPVNEYGVYCEEGDAVRELAHTSAEYITKLSDSAYQDFISTHWDKTFGQKKPYEDALIWEYAGTSNGLPYAVQYSYDKDGNKEKNVFRTDYDKTSGQGTAKFFNENGVYVALREVVSTLPGQDAVAFSTTVSTGDVDIAEEDYNAWIAMNYTNGKYYEWEDDEYYYRATATLVEQEGAYRFDEDGRKVYITTYDHLSHKSGAGTVYNEGEEYTWDDGTYYYVMRPVFVKYITIGSYVEGAVFEDKLLGASGDDSIMLDCHLDRKADHFALGCGMKQGDYITSDDDHIEETFLMTDKEILEGLGIDTSKNPSVLVKNICKYHTEQDVKDGILSQYEAQEEGSIVDWGVGYVKELDHQGNPIKYSDGETYKYIGCKTDGVEKTQQYACGIASMTLIGYATSCNKYSQFDVKLGVSDSKGDVVTATPIACSEHMYSLSDELIGTKDPETGGEYRGSALIVLYGPYLESSATDSSIKATPEKYKVSCGITK